jgi:hypothetical protein
MAPHGLVTPGPGAHRALLAALVVGVCASGLAAPAAGAGLAPATRSDGIFLWRGFEHRWQYNHRYNRLGDSVAAADCGGGRESCRARILHTGASGTVPDTAAATSHFWEIQAAGVGFHQAPTTLFLRGAEDREVTARRVVRVPVASPGLANLRDRNKYQVLLNGFDLVSQRDADKLVELGFGVGDPRYDAARREVVFTAWARAKLGCATPECEPDESVGYRLGLEVAIIAGDGQVAATSRTFRRSYTWPDQPRPGSLGCGSLFDAQHGGGPELFLSPVTGSIRGAGKALTGEGALGFRSLALSLDVEHDILEQNAAILPRSFDGRRYTFGLDLLYKNWAAGMQGVREPFSRCSFGEPGRADLRADVSLLQFHSRATVHPRSSRCTIDWPGLNRPPDDPLSRCTRSRSFRIADLAPPSIRVRGVPRRCTSRSFRGRARVRDESSLRRVRVLVDRRRVRSRGRARVSFRVPARRLGGGSHRISARARDAARNRATARVRFRRCAGKRRWG